MAILQNKKLWVALFVALIVRVAYVSLVPPRPITWDDTLSWNNNALLLLKGEGLIQNGESWDIKRPPVYPFFIAGIYWVFGANNYAAVKVFQAILGALSLLFFYLVARRFLEKWICDFWVWVLSLYPPLIVYCEIMQSETLFIFLFALFLFFWVRMEQSWRWQETLLAGLFLGIADLTRPALMFLPAFFLWNIWAAPREEKLKAIQHYALLVAISIIVILPWSWRNHRVYGKAIPIALGGSEQFYFGTLPWEEQRKFGASLVGQKVQHSIQTIQETDSIYYSAGFLRIRQDPWAYLRLTGIKALFYFFQPQGAKLTSSRFPLLGVLIYAGYAVLVLLSFLGMWRARHLYPKIIPLLLMVIYFALLHIPLAPEPRYRLPVDPLIVLFALYGLAAVGSRVRAR